MTDADLDKLEAHPTNDPTNPLHRLGYDLQVGWIKDLAVSADVDYALHEIARLQASARRDAEEIERLREALSRQLDNISFLLNRCAIADAWYEKFCQEHAEDSKVRARAAHTGEG